MKKCAYIYIIINYIYACILQDWYPQSPTELPP